jgi:hypothetical protein
MYWYRLKIKWDYKKKKLPHHEFTVMEICLSSRCLAMAVPFGSAIQAAGHYVTMFFFLYGMSYRIYKTLDTHT